MNQHPDEQARFSEHGQGLGTVTEDMVRKRAEGIALRNGRNKTHVSESDVAQARRELTGEEGLSPTAEPAEEIPAEPRPEGLEGSHGGRSEVIPTPDEQTFAEKLVEEGVADAEEERAEEATREASKKDNLE